MSAARWTRPKPPRGKKGKSPAPEPPEPGPGPEIPPEGKRFFLLAVDLKTEPRPEPIEREEGEPCPALPGRAFLLPDSAPWVEVLAADERPEVLRSLGRKLAIEPAAPAAWLFEVWAYSPDAIRKGAITVRPGGAERLEPEEGGRQLELG